MTGWMFAQSPSPVPNVPAPPLPDGVKALAIGIALVLVGMALVAWIRRGRW